MNQRPQPVETGLRTAPPFSKFVSFENAKAADPVDL